MRNQTKFAVYEQRKPIPTGEVTYKDDQEIRWHAANLVLVGVADDWASAKRLTPVPVVEAVKTQ